MPKVARESWIELDPESSYGPAMRALTDTRKRFVIAYVWFGGVRKSPAEAARKAGIGGTERSTNTSSKILMRDPKVLAALREETDKLLTSYGAAAAHRLNELLQSDNEKVALDASKSLLGFAGHTLNRTEHKLIIQDEFGSTQEILDYVEKTLAKFDPKRMARIDAAERAVDVEFVRIAAPEDSREDQVEGESK